MYINKIGIKNFRIFDEHGIQVILKKGVNAIIGENNSGKSALLDAIRIAFSAVQYKKEIFFNKSDLHIDICGNQSKTAEIDIYLEEVPLYLIEIWNAEAPTTGEFHIRFYMETSPSGVEKVKYKAWGGNIEGNPISPDTFDAMNIAFLGALRDSENEMKPSRNSKLANLLSSLTPEKEQKNELTEQLCKANIAIMSMQAIQNTKKIINKNLLDIEQDVLRQQVDIGLIEPRFESISSSLRSWIVPRWYYISDDFSLYEKINEDCKTKELQKFVQKAEHGMFLDINSYLNSGIDLAENEKLLLLGLMKHSFELCQNGLGYNNLLFMSTVLGDMSLNKKGIELNLFTIEEPEAHLHPQLQELIHSFFERCHQRSSSIQIIYTSHSPTLVSRIGINAINLLYEDSHKTCCYPLSTARLDTMEKEYLEKYLDTTKARMFFAKGIIFVEGISEALLIAEMAKLLDRPLDKYAVELINVDGTSFEPFVKILSLPSGGKSFAKAAILTDDDRCADKGDQESYISKDLDYDSDLTSVIEKIASGKPSARYDNVKKLCENTAIEVCGAKKTFEYELSMEKNNIPYLLKAIMTVFPKVGLLLKNHVEKQESLELKTSMIWLFIRAREKSKAQIAQYLTHMLQKQIIDLAERKDIENPFIVPKYIANAIYAVTEAKE